MFTSWDDCKLQVIGYPGASYKGFFTKEEAMEFLGDVTDKKVKALKDELRVAVYVDRKSVVYGKSVDLGGRRIIKKK